MKQKNYAKAVETYKNALRNNPQDEETRYNYAVAKELLKKEQQQQDNQDQNQDNKDQKNQKDQDNQENKDQDKESDKDQDSRENNDDSEIEDNQAHELHENEYLLSLCPGEPVFCMSKNEHDAPFLRAQLRVRSLPPHFRQRLDNIQFLFA